MTGKKEPGNLLVRAAGLGINPDETGKIRQPITAVALGWRYRPLPM